MATYTLRTGATDLAVADSYSPATAPSGWTNGDILLIPDGTEATTNNNAINAASKVLNRIVVSPECSRQIGSPGDPFICDVSNGSGPYFSYGGRGQLWYNPGSGNTTTEVRLLTSSSAPIVLGEGTITTLSMRTGQVVQVGGACVVTNIYKTGGTLTVDYNSTSITLFEDHAGEGKARVRRTIATANVSRSGRSTSQIMSAQFFRNPANIDLILEDGTTSTSAKIDTKITLRGGYIYNHRGSGAIDAFDIGPFCVMTPVGAEGDVDATTSGMIWERAVIDQNAGGVSLDVPSAPTEIGEVNSFFGF